MANKPAAERQSMADAAAELEALMEDTDEQELRQIHAGGVKDSKWRRVVDNFLDSGKPMRKFVIPDDGPIKLGAVTSGLQNVKKRSEDAGAPLPISITSSKLKKTVILVNTELYSEEEAEAEVATA